MIQMGSGRLEVIDGSLYCKPPYFPSREIGLELGGKWDKNRKSWRLPLLWSIAVELTRRFPGIQISNQLQSFLSSEWGFDRVTPPLEHRSWNRLFPYQRDGVLYLMSTHKPGALLALSPGLGKTAVATVAADSLEVSRILVVSTLALLWTWEREIKKWGRESIEESISIEHGTGPHFSSRWVITNYDTVIGHLAEYQEHWDLIILDESVLVKNRRTRRFDSLKKLRDFTDRVWLLSGSPITRYVDDLWTQFHLIEPRSFTSYWRFTERYCHVWKSTWGYQILGSRSEIDFQSEFRDLMFVKHQKDVLPDLPDLLFESYDLQLTPDQVKIYKEFKSGFVAELSSEIKLSVTDKLARLTRLIQVVSNLGNLGHDWPDVSVKADAIEELLEARSIPLPTIIWGHFVRGMSHLRDRLKKKFSELRTEIVTGDTPDDFTSQLLADFQEGKIDILILSLGVGKFGHTLTTAQSAVYLDRTFSADDYVQSLHRIHRIGLDHRPVVVTLRVPGSVEELIERNLSGKMMSISQVTNADLQQLLESLSL